MPTRHRRHGAIPRQRPTLRDTPGIVSSAEASTRPVNDELVMTCPVRVLNGFIGQLDSARPPLGVSGASTLLPQTRERRNPCHLLGIQLSKSSGTGRSKALRKRGISMARMAESDRLHTHLGIYLTCAAAPRVPLTEVFDQRTCDLTLQGIARIFISDGND